MKLTRCSKGHFYDADSYAFCPHCPPEIPVDNGVMPDFEPDGGTRAEFVGHFAEDKGVGAFPQSVPFEGENKEISPVPDTPQSLHIEPEPPAAYEDINSQPVYLGDEQASREFKASDILNDNKNIEQDENAGAFDEKNFEADNDINKIPPQITPASPDKDDEHTVGVFSSQTVFAKEPVVGWLVCIEGLHIGEDFRLVEGRNFIGRAKNMNVCLSQDRYVSRNKHLVLTFEPRNSEFIVQPGESKELSYLNDNVILQPEKIKEGDIITLGRTKFRFIPYCSGEYKWNK